MSVLLFIEEGYVAKSAWEENRGFIRGLLTSPWWTAFELVTSDDHFDLP